MYENLTRLRKPLVLEARPVGISTKIQRPSLLHLMTLKNAPTYVLKSLFGLLYLCFLQRYFTKYSYCNFLFIIIALYHNLRDCLKTKTFQG